LLDLAGVWTLSDDTGTHVVPMAVPGDGISALHAAGVIPDPYWGRNEYDCRWVAERDWVLTRRFSVDRTDLALQIDMLDTVAEVLVNGQSVLKADTMFRRHVAGLSSALRMGENEISIRFASSVREAAARQAEMPFYIPYAAQNCPIPHGNMLRKPACDSGWDWNIALAPFGVYGGVALEPAGPRIGDVIVAQRHRPGLAEVMLTVQAQGDRVTASLCGVTATAATQGGVAHLTLAIPDPDLWWPAGLGPQRLQTLTLTAGNATTTRRIGLRDLRLVSAPDAAGRSFAFSCNGHPVFARGANWIPADALAGRITPDAVRGLLQSAVDANMNMIRVWGGGRYEPDWFYDMCDELGLMVWQDFMFACHLYPSTPAFLREVDAEVRDVVARIGHHACIALWCGDNELIGALSWFEESLKDRDRYLVSYDRLNRTIEAALRETAPEANWWPSSPSPGPLSFGDAWHDDSSGDMHFWSVWHEGRDFDHYRDVRPRFCSEFGFQSYPSMCVIRRFADPKDWNIASPVMESHQKNAGGNARIAETMFRYFRFPVDFANFLYLSQVQQGLAIKTAVTQWRSLKPHCMGTLYWQLNDTWPVCSWSSLDHGGNWKLLHHMAQQFFAPVIVSIVPTPQGFDLIAVNDTRAVVDLTVTALATRMDGQVRRLAGAVVAVGTDAAVTVMRVPAEDLAADDMLAVTWTDGGQHRGGDVFAPRPYKTYPLHPARIAMQVAAQGAAWRITLGADALALFVAIEADQPGRFSLNAFTLFPGHDATVIFTPDASGAPPVFTVRDLHSATHSPIHKEA
jgi:beta-mannosidase